MTQKVDAMDKKAKSFIIIVAMIVTGKIIDWFF